MDQDWKECVINDSYKSTMMSMAELSSRCSNVMISINALAAFFLSIGEYLLQSSMGNVSGVDNNSRELPIKMEFPFDVSESPTFEFFLVGQFFYELVLASIVGMMNALLVSLVSFAMILRSYFGVHLITNNIYVFFFSFISLIVYNNVIVSWVI